ncbi:hypothetical protein [Actinacidiphila paucisporea]|uniref:Uncharacterized protein n=1 Tax=Actinacidiphila paucisporea TaxID=310782 RepID=A0A1M7PYD6_9ACTN|nr:hypothetical protein [Actinacidiphila paucisporea]SHN22832.1 hypothetical protein SAMN05216499_12744 [Actinacidiphila paucisporea]
MTGSTRLERRIRRDFPEPGSAPEILRILNALPDAAGYANEELRSERIRAAIVLFARGDITKFRQAVELAKLDWRDVLVAGELADADWAIRLDAELGPEGQGPRTHDST